MSYNITHSDNSLGSIVVEDLTINNETSLKFVGKNAVNYGPIIAENFLHLLENFANTEMPSNPTLGQLWYDTNEPAQLKIWDGTAFNAAGSVKKTVGEQPTTNAIGDLWINTATQQVYLWSGTSWILVGPPYSESVKTGTKVETVKDTLNNDHVIIKFVINERLIAVISDTSFVPKILLRGFPKIRPGINLSSILYDSSVQNKLWGVAEKASALLINNTTVDAINFLRTDVVNNTNKELNIKNDGGITVGLSSTTSLYNNGLTETILSNSADNSSIILKVKKEGQLMPVLTVNGNNVGINNRTPNYELDVNGTIKSTEGIIVTSTSDSISKNTGSIVVKGGIGISKSVNIGENLTVFGNTTINNIIPSVTASYDIGSSANVWNNIYANTITATRFVGSLNGDITGSASNALTLRNSTNFSLTGDISSNIVSFNGQQPNNELILNTVLNQEVIDNKDEIGEVLQDDELLINRPGEGLYKVTKQNLFVNLPVIPVGTIFPFAGITIPSGYLLCDGSEQLRSEYPELYNTIGNTFKPISELKGVLTFGLPDLRGRFPLGMDSMNNRTMVPSNTTGQDISTIEETANRVTSQEADIIGASKGNEDIKIEIKNLPDHKHNLRGNAETQYYAYRNASGDPIDTDAITGTGATSVNSGQYLTNSGSIMTTGQTDLPITVMNPYLTINYIIYTGKI